MVYVLRYRRKQTCINFIVTATILTWTLVFLSWLYSLSLNQEHSEKLVSLLSLTLFSFLLFQSWVDYSLKRRRSIESIHVFLVMRVYLDLSISFFEFSQRDYSWTFYFNTLRIMFEVLEKTGATVLLWIKETAVLVNVFDVLTSKKLVLIIDWLF